MDFVFEQIRCGGDRNFGYLIGHRTASVAAFVDPSYAPERFVERSSAQGLEVRWIINTHGHGDHTNGNKQAKKLTGAAIAAHPGSPVRPDHPLEDGEEIAVGTITIRALHVPGHTPDHLALFLPAEKILITGDLLFVGKIGGTGTEDDARREYESLGRLLAELPDETTVWPGHDYGCRPSTTLGLEKLTNPFLLAKSFEQFLELKGSWAAYKARHGLL